MVKNFEEKRRWEYSGRAYKHCAAKRVHPSAPTLGSSFP
ncbi:hypothetical protein WCLE_004820 [Wolbachia endosymbiont of Cimex lectularius]|nr:hypothetical protein WCLE_004820 [Wolbachia endosymbiont of Cimex lectularius]